LHFLLPEPTPSFQLDESQEEEAMKRYRIANLLMLFVFGFVVFFAGSTETNAQSRRDDYRDRYRNDSRYDRQRRNRDSRLTNQGMSRRDVNVLLLQGYENGLRAGRQDRSRNKYNASNVYRNTPSLPYNGDTSSADYLYRQGYLEGYEDGYNGRVRY
jgi:hypothetical protein